jgi:hypothetical protein
LLFSRVKVERTPDPIFSPVSFKNTSYSMDSIGTLKSLGFFTKRFPAIVKESLLKSLIPVISNLSSEESLIP